MSRSRVLIATLPLLLMGNVPAIGLDQTEPDVNPRTAVANLARENQRLRAALQSCAEERDAARQELARIARVGSKPTSDSDHPRNASPPDRNVQYFHSFSGGDDIAADQAVSPIPFPQVPKQTDWLDHHLTRQFDLLKRLYTTSALQGLPQDEAQCSNPRTRLYCQMAVRLYWISSTR